MDIIIKKYFDDLINSFYFSTSLSLDVIDNRYNMNCYHLHLILNQRNKKRHDF